MTDLVIKVEQQEGSALVVRYTGEYNTSNETVNIDRKVKIQLPTLANWSVVSEAIKLAVRTDYAKHFLIGRTLTIQVPENPEEAMTYKDKKKED